MRHISLALLTAASTLALTQMASAADMSVKAPIYKPPVVMPLYNWTGFYAGLNLGGSWGSQDNSLTTLGGTTLLSNSDHLNGVIGGGQIGYNYQVNQWVLGLEADFQGSGQKDDGSFFIPGGVGAVPGTSIAYTNKLDWFGTVRGRVGYAIDRWLPYVTGGFAYGHGQISGTTTIGATATSFSANQDYTGWAIGGGVEWAFMNSWSAKIEYLYIDFGDGPTVPVSATQTIVSGRMTDNIVRAGVNYKF
jgi:outer membrane immunogenic protein